MDYLDYLPHTNYDELPPKVQATIDREAYRHRQQLAKALGPPAPDALPQQLVAAFQARKHNNPPPISFEPRRRFIWLAAAGWLLFVLTGALLFQVRGEEKIVYQLVSAPVVRDTVVETVIEKVIVTRYDTVIQYREAAPNPAQYVYLRDTVYLPSNSQFVADSINVSQPAARNLRYLDLLIETE